MTIRHLMKLNVLTPEEKKIIIDKGTEPPGSGEYLDHKGVGTYVCRQCNSPLYTSSNKFDSRCGWPSFDDAIPGKVDRVMDQDGYRTEIICATCGGHLGHVFVGERLTEKNTRHCVNSLSMKFIPETVEDPGYQLATFGGGCFWCIEAVFQKIKGVIQVNSGHMGGWKDFPSYDEVGRKDTGHIEVVRIVFDPKLISYKKLLQVFFTIHDPTTKDQQGADKGPQYASVVFYHTSEQHAIVDAVIASLEAENVFEKNIVTRVKKAETFWIAESYHQNYYQGNSGTMYCAMVIGPKINKLRQDWKELLKQES